MFEWVKSIETAFGKGVVYWQCILLAFIWVIWGFRNDIIFNGVRKCSKALVEEIKNVAFRWISSRGKSCNLLNWDLWFVNPIQACISLKSH